MTDSRLNVETLARRLEKVERENRRVRWAGGSVALLVAFSMLTGATNTPTQLDRDVSRLRTLIAEEKTKMGILDVHRLSILDDDGKVRATLGMEKDGPGLRLYDANEKSRAMLMAPKDGPSLGLFDGNGKVRVMLFLDNDETARGSGLGLNDANGKPRVSLTATPTWQDLTLANANGKIVWSAP